jgi:site-specific DNA recombinase
MKTAAIYCRVSTDNQEREGTSLQTQLENCLAYCRGKGYDVAYRFSEAYSGLSLERPEMDKLRELVRAEDIDAVVIYCLDRLSRNATHGVILRDELDKYHVLLESVTEDIDKTPLGEAITYLRGTFSQIEAEKIKERTMRGKKARAREGRMTGGFHITYGYDYVRTIRGERQAMRVINEVEAYWVRQIFEWLAYDGLTCSVIRDRLIASNAPTKTGKPWSRSTVVAIAKNPAYAGKTYAFTSVRHRARQKPQAEWIEIPDVTPAIITLELYETAQKQLQVNRDRASRNNTKRLYLLRSHIKCRQCGHAYGGGAGSKKADGSYRRVYLCTARQRGKYGHRCFNKSWGADRLEAMVWSELSRYLSDRDLILSQLEAQRQDTGQVSVFETELERVERQLKALNREQHQLLQWALKDFPADQVEAENRRLNKAKETLKAQKADLEKQLKASQDAVINVPKLEGFIRDIQDKLPNLDFEGKRLALDMLGITVWLDGENVEVTGVIDLEGVFVTTQSTG